MPTQFTIRLEMTDMLRRFVIAACLVATTAAYADDRAVAKKLYDDGLRHYNVAEYADAIAAWKQAYLLAKKPILLFNIGQAYRLAGDCKQAVTFYDSYEREEPHPNNQDELDQARVLCKEAITTGTADHSAATPDHPMTPTPTPTTTDTPTTTPTTTTTVATTSTSPSPSRSTTTTTSTHLAAYVVGGAGLALGVTGIVFALDARAQDHKNVGVVDWTAENNSIQARGQRDDKLAIAFGAIGVAGIATGVVLYALGRGGDEHGVAMAPTRGGVRVTWARSF
jgi:tetratricopeptide (TPR) repeat protein